MRPGPLPRADGAGFDLVFADTCVGGSTVAARVGREPAGRRALYLADYSVHPLGTKLAPAVRAALDRWVRLAADVSRMLVVACNTASVRLEECPDVRALAADLGLRLFSMVDLLDHALAARPGALKDRRVCLMGTCFTVSHPVYSERLLRAGARQVVPLAATRTELTIAHLQHTTFSGEAAITSEIRHEIRRCDAVLLACTCFPLASGLIARLNPRCEQLDPAAGIDGLLPKGRSENANDLTLATSGAGPLEDVIRLSAPALFPGWRVAGIEEVPPA